jgi:hypothetical protein
MRPVIIETQIPDSAVEPLCAAVGHVVVNWALVEIGIDQWIAAIYRAGGDKRPDWRAPATLDRKIKFLRRCFSRFAGRSPLADEALALLDRAESLRITRHILVHGVLADYTPASGAFSFVKMDLNEWTTMEIADRLDTTVTRILDDSEECIALAAAMTKFSHRLLDATAG